MLYIAASYKCLQVQEKLMNQTWENGKKTSLGPILADLAQIRAAKCFFFSNIWLFVSHYHHVQYQKKLMIQSWENLVTYGRTNVERQTSLETTSKHISTTQRNQS